MSKTARKEATLKCYESLIRSYKDSIELYAATKSGAVKERIRRLIINLFDRAEGIDAIKDLETIDQELGIKSIVRASAMTQTSSASKSKVITFKGSDFEKKRAKDVKYVDGTEAVQDLMKSKMKKSEDLIGEDLADKTEGDATGTGVSNQDNEANAILASIKVMTGEQLIEQYQTMAAFKVFIAAVKGDDVKIPRKNTGEDTAAYMERLRDIL